MTAQTDLAFTCFVPGKPEPEGSYAAYPFRRKDGSLGATVTTANKKLRPWRDAMEKAFVIAAKQQGIATFDCPVSAGYEFILPRLKPCAQAKSGVAEVRPETAEDLDKLERAVNDSLTDSKVIKNDSRICNVHRKFKRVAAVGESPGVLVEIRPITKDGEASFF